MNFTGSATGFIKIQSGRLLFEEEKTGFQLGFSSDDLQSLRRISEVKSRVHLLFEPLNMHDCRIKPLQLVRRPEEYSSLVFRSAFRFGEFHGGYTSLNSTFLSGNFMPQDDEDVSTLVEVDPVRECMFYSAMRDGSSANAGAGIVLAEFGVASNLCNADKVLYSFVGIERFFGYNEWFDALKRDVPRLSSGTDFEEERPSQRTRRKPISSRLRYEVLLRDGHRCVDCGASAIEDPLVRLEIDHRVPVSKGGTNDKENLQTLCWACNNGKSDNIDHKLSATEPQLDPWADAA